MIGNWKTFEKHYPTTALNVFYAKYTKILPAYFSKHNLKHESYKSYFFNNSKWRRMELSYNKKSPATLL